MSVIIRDYHPADLEAIYEICLLIGDNGKDATPLYRERRILGDLYAGAYGRFSPELAFTAEDAEGVCGFTLGVLDTAGFDARLEREWWPALRQVYRDPGDVPADRRDADQRAAYLIHHPPLMSGAVLADYPSHLHIDVLPRLQGQGVGGRLMQTLLDALRAAGSRGVHLVVSAGNPRAIGFYRHVGFAELARDERSFTLGKRL
ncbi:MAG TPA: GNAT family N-acetyltransferase [Dongiaceae bacterium]|jgi:ribosomal protein S18 acetylase RimI-like enzyme|nr:GNAT family N-acetyltransferase [Dongiaceae bacterium]